MIMNRRQIRNRHKILDQVNKQYTDQFVIIPTGDWPPQLQNETAIRLHVYRNNKFLVQIFNDNNWIRISINRTIIGNNGHWVDDITWDELQIIKSQIGYGNFMAVEIYPKDKDIVNVANMRHLWIINDKTELGWRS